MVTRSYDTTDADEAGLEAVLAERRAMGPPAVATPDLDALWTVLIEQRVLAPARALAGAATLKVVSDGLAGSSPETIGKLAVLLERTTPEQLAAIIQAAVDQVSEQQPDQKV